MPSPDSSKSEDLPSEAKKFHLAPHILNRILRCPSCDLFECLKLNNRHVLVCPGCGSTSERFQSSWGWAKLREMHKDNPNVRVEECCLGQMVIIELDTPCSSCRYRTYLALEEERRKQTCQKDTISQNTALSGSPARSAS